MKLTILAGTNRPGSNTRKVVAIIARLYEEIGSPAGVLDLAELPAEIFSPAAYATKPASFRRFSDEILASDGLHVVTPEYNGGFPGVLKYFIDMLKFPESLDRRPVAFTGLSAGQWGALRPVEQLQALFAYRNAYLYPERVFLPNISSLLTSDGRIEREDLVERLKSQAGGFAAYVARIRGA